jgi:hypothetical protein
MRKLLNTLNDWKELLLLWIGLAVVVYLAYNLN